MRFFDRYADAAVWELLQDARDILTSAGYDAGSLEAVGPLLQSAARNNDTAKQLGNRGGSPRWSN